MEEIIEEIEIEDDEEEIELEQLDISDIGFRDKTLDEWEAALTVKIPSLPANVHEIIQCTIDITNKYQDAYNAYNELIVYCNAAEREFKTESSNLITRKTEELKASGLKRMPSRENMVGLIVASSRRLRVLSDRLEMLNIVKQFFENNKTKLEKIMIIVKDLRYSIVTNDRMHNEGAVGHGS